jgi:hypothetical protein
VRGPLERRKLPVVAHTHPDVRPRPCAHVIVGSAYNGLTRVRSHLSASFYFPTKHLLRPLRLLCQKRMAHPFQVVPNERRRRSKGEDKRDKDDTRESDLFECTQRSDPLCRANATRFAVLCNKDTGKQEFPKEIQKGWERVDPCSDKQVDLWKRQVRDLRTPPLFLVPPLFLPPSRLSMCVCR